MLFWLPMGLWHRLHNPSVYQGVKKKTDYFEGWYFKLVSHNEEHAIGLIPGISLGEDPHAFLQIIDGRAETSHYLRFDVKTFVADPKIFRVRVGPHYFSPNKVILDSPEVAGELTFRKLVPWNPSFLKPGIMGWYSYVPFMQCYHGLVSMNHELSGQISLAGVQMDFRGGKGYTEKDWGRSFPRSWIWMQCNHFDRDLSVMASVAHIPWLGTHFTGFLAVIWINNELKLYTTYTGAKYSAKLHDDGVELEFSDRTSRLMLYAQKGAGVELRSPLFGNMTGKVSESLTASIKLEYSAKGDKTVVASGSSAGLEVAGDAEELTK